MMGPLAAINSAFAKIFTVSGRACRSEYWWFCGFSVLVAVGAFAFDAWTIYLAFQKSPQPDISFNPFDYFSFYAWVIFYVPKKTVTIRRLHDIGKSGWVLLLSLIPLVGLILIYWALQDSEQGVNQWGDCPSD